jgi:hypothetical protein
MKRPPIGSNATESDPSPRDFALTGSTLFSNDPLSGGVRIYGAHVNELRAAIDALRYATNSLAPVWNGAAVSGTMHASDITSLLSG